MNVKTIITQDAILYILSTVVGGVAFGFWQHSWVAAIVGYQVLRALNNIAFGVEYPGTEKYKD